MPTNSLAKRVAANVRAEMGRRGHTQTSLAAKIGTRQQYLSRRLRGETQFTVDELQRIADALDISITLLIQASAVEVVA